MTGNLWQRIDRSRLRVTKSLANLTYYKYDTVKLVMCLNLIVILCYASPRAWKRLHHELAETYVASKLKRGG